MPDTDLQSLATTRIEDAQALLAAKRWDAAYYLAGYAVECAIKSCILKRLTDKLGWIPDRRFSENCFTHDLSLLLKWADLENEMKGDPDVYASFGTVKDWNEEKRYQLGCDQKRAEDFLEAVNDPKKGYFRGYRNTGRAAQRRWSTIDSAIRAGWTSCFRCFLGQNGG